MNLFNIDGARYRFVYLNIPFWMLDGQHFIWYRRVRESRNYHDACWVHYLTVGRKTFRWETR